MLVRAMPMTMMTMATICVDNFLIYRRRVKNGIKFGAS